MAAEFPYRVALPGYHYEFPRDHFEHPQFRTEWWYYTGNVRTDAGRRFGFELVFFRQAQPRRDAPGNRSAWRVDDLYLAHLALTDVADKHFYAHRRLNRRGPGIAGASFARRRIWNGNWSAQWEGGRQMLEATADEFRFRLRVAPLKPPVIHGVNGVSQKAEGAGKASHYVSFSRLAADGEIETGGARHQVKGTAWMDHEWFTHQLEDSQAGWDWFSVQLDDGRDLMLFELRRKDGSIDPNSAGTYVDAAGKSRHLTAMDFSLAPQRYWLSPHTKARYPLEWRVRVPPLALTLDARPVLDDQELAIEDQTAPDYWEGAVDFTGSAAGVGYLEMTGYGKPVRLE